jgi:hypothetical protein
MHQHVARVSVVDDGDVVVDRVVGEDDGPTVVLEALVENRRCG